MLAGLIFALFILCILLTPLVHVMWAAGLLWAPFSALLCFKAAKKRGISGWRHAARGAAYSVLLALPGLYLLMRLRGWDVHRSQIIAAYALCGLGFLALIGSSYGMFFSAGYTLEEQTSLMFGILYAVMLLLAVVASAELYALLKGIHPLYRNEKASGRFSLNRAQLSPFFYLWLGDIGWVILLLRT